MAKNGKIGHDGIVKSVSAQTVEITIVSESACRGCHAKSACGLADLKQKIITAQRPDFPLSPGEKVIVYASTKNAAYSVLLAYVLPVILLIAIPAVLTGMDYSEIIAATGAIIGVVIYFFILYFNRKQLSKKIKFTVEKTGH